jgi:hypothetical protein
VLFSFFEHKASVCQYLLGSISLSYFVAGMSEIQDRAKTAPVKSQTIRDTGFPVSGKKFHLVPFKPPVSSGQERS